MRLAFMGTPDFAARALIELIGSGQEIAAVYTRAPQPSGRGQKLTPSPVEVVAGQSGIPVRTPRSFRNAEAVEALAALDADAAIVVAYGLILPQAALDATRLGAFNLHASLLPRWRGAAPIQRAIEAGDTVTGVDLMQMEVGLDTGPVVLERQTAIDPTDTGGSLHDRLAGLAAEVLAEGLQRLAAGRLPPPRAQSTEGVCYARKLDKAEAMLDWRQAASVLARKVRAFDPWPIAEAEIAGERLRVHAAQALTGSGGDAAPGSIVAAGAEGIDIACGEGVLRLTRVQRPGGTPVSARDYVNARPAVRTS
ncbi:MAG TPA: methionyl-tRNA formyltransferase [Xanthomonadales bacterium]|nr:methionyl-tRNA formyltransferase [Xanthomonadales bacterium]